MDAPSIRYTQSSDGLNLAWWSVGSGPPLLYLPWFGLHHAAVSWEVPAVNAFIERLAQRRRVISYDYRGTGLSDRAAVDFSIEARLVDVDAVLRAAAASPVDVFAEGDCTVTALCYAAGHPDAIASLVLWNPIIEPMDFGRLDETVALLKSNIGLWLEGFLDGTGGDPSLTQDYVRLMTACMSADAWAACMEVTTNATDETDISDRVREVGAQTLILHRRGAPLLPVERSAALAAQMQAARLEVVEGTAALSWDGDVEAIGARVDSFFGTPDAEAAAEPSPFRTILFTDVVASTPLLAQLKDEKMRAVMRDHDEVLEAAVTDNGGRVVKTIGDAFMAEFAVPSRAVEAAIAAQRGIRDKFADSDVPIRLRIGVNAGEPIEEDGDLHGASVVIAKRLESEADDGGILVSEVVRQAVAGKEFEFTDRSEVSLKGFDEPVRAWSVDWK